MQHQEIFQLTTMKDSDIEDQERAQLGIDIILFPISILQKKGKSDQASSDASHGRSRSVEALAGLESNWQKCYVFSAKRHEKNKASTQDLLLALTGCKFERKTIYGAYNCYAA